MNKVQWKAYYRLLRIARRESAKAAMDMMLFGFGCIEIGADLPDLCRHVPLETMVVA